MTTRESFDPDEFVALARKLSTDGGYDAGARARSAVGRAYYALFLSVRSAIRAAQQAPTHGRGDHVDHGEVPNALYYSDDPKLAAVAKLLQEAYQARRVADYELEPVDRDGRLLTPRRADQLAKRVAAQIRGLNGLDFSKAATYHRLTPPESL